MIQLCLHPLRACFEIIYSCVYFDSVFLCVFSTFVPEFVVI